MHYLIYLSTPVGRLDDNDYLGIMKSAHRNNNGLEVTGMLLATEGYFLQLLEGEQERVRALYHRIALDKRHDNLFILDEGTCERRYFGAWQMGFEYMNWLGKARLEALSPILKSPEWKWSEEELKHRPIFLLDQFRKQFRAQ